MSPLPPNSTTRAPAPERPASGRALVVGLLGGIGSGKSAVAAEFARRGAVVLNADELGHEALRQPEVRGAVLARWPSARGPDGEIDRRALAKLIFADPAERRALEALTHPWIKRRIEAEIAKATLEWGTSVPQSGTGRNCSAGPAPQSGTEVPHSKAPLIVLDAAVMLEAGWHGVCDRLVFVDAPHEARLARVTARRGWTAKDLEDRESAQLPLTEKRSRADHVIDNSFSPDRLGQQVEDLMRRWGLAVASRE